MLARVTLSTLAVAALFAAQGATAEQPRAALKSLTVFPERVNLDGPRDEQRLVVLGEYADGRRWDLTREATFTPSAAKVAKADGGVVRPVGDGVAVVTARAGGQSVNVPVTVKRATAEVPVSFSREV